MGRVSVGVPVREEVIPVLCRELPLEWSAGGITIPGAVGRTRDGTGNAGVDTLRSRS
jgi:hypothetical protein